MEASLDTSVHVITEYHLIAMLLGACIYFCLKFYIHYLNQMISFDPMEVAKYYSPVHPSTIRYTRCIVVS